MEQHKVDIDSSYNDDNVMRADVWFEYFGGLFWFQNLWFMGGKRDNKEWDLSCEHPSPRV